MVRHSLNYVSWKLRKVVAADLKTIYAASTVDEAQIRLQEFDDKGGADYPTCAREVADIWRRTSDFRGAQMVFCDLSSPKGGKGFIRSLEDVELATLSYAEVKALASGNPLVIEKAGVDAEVAKLSTLFSLRRNQRYVNESEVGRLPMMIEG